MQKIQASITGINCWMPPDKLTNADLEKMVDTNDEWIRTRTGIKERRILKGDNKGTSYMATKAVEGLLKKTNTNPEDIELVICCTVTPDMVFPATANIVANNTGMINSFGYDLNAACSGFIFGLNTAAQFIKSGTYKKVIVIGADKMSSIVDYTDRQVCIIFGDGAGAVLIEASEDGNGIIDAQLHADGSGAPYLHQKAGGSLKPASHQTVDAREHFIYQEGKAVFKFAVKNMADVAEDIMKKNKLNSDDIAWLVPHQANKRIIDATSNRMGLPSEKVMINIDHFGNTTNATIPSCLWEWEDKLKKGDNIVLAAFGGGFTWGAIYLKWSYDSKN